MESLDDLYEKETGKEAFYEREDQRHPGQYYTYPSDEYVERTSLLS